MQILICRDLYDDTPHYAQKAAYQQSRVWDESENLGLTQDYYPAVDMETADLYIGGESNMLEELMEWISKSQPYFMLSVKLIARQGENVEDFERFLYKSWLDFEEE